MHLTGDLFDLETVYTFQDLGGRTRVTQTCGVTGRGLVRFLMLLMGWRMKLSHCQASQNELRTLKQFCQKRPPGDPSAL